MLRDTVLPGTPSEQIEVVELDLVFLHRDRSERTQSNQWSDLVDLNIGYDVGPWTARFIVSNVFGEKYHVNNYQTLLYGNVPGAPANLSLGIRRTF